MTLEVRGASAAPSKVCSPQNTKFPPASGLKCFWTDTLVFLRIYLFAQQTLFSFQTKTLQVFRERSYSGCTPQTSKGQSAKRNSGARPGPRSRNTANCPAPKGPQVLEYPPPPRARAPLLSLHLDSTREWVVTWIALRGQVF